MQQNAAHIAMNAAFATLSILGNEKIILGKSNQTNSPI